MPVYWSSRIQQQHMNMFWGSEVLHWTPVLCLIAQSCPILWDPMDGSPPGSSVHGILQARIQEWVAIPSSRGSSQPRSPTLQADSLLSEPSGKTMNTGVGRLSLLQGSITGIFLTQVLNQGLMHYRQILYQCTGHQVGTNSLPDSAPNTTAAS